MEAPADRSGSIVAWRPSESALAGFRSSERKHRLVAAVVDLRLRRGSGRDVVVSTPSEVPVIIFSGVPSESAELERLRPRTRLIEKPYSLVLLVETLEEMLSESQNLHS